MTDKPFLLVIVCILPLLQAFLNKMLRCNLKYVNIVVAGHYLEVDNNYNFTNIVDIQKFNQSTQ